MTFDKFSSLLKTFENKLRKTQILLLYHSLFLFFLHHYLFLTDSWELKHATRNISPTNNQANIVDLHPASVYSIRMYSYNAIGKSEASKELTISTEEARKSPFNTAFFSSFFFLPL